MVRTRVRWPVLALLSLALSVGFLAGRASGDTGRSVPGPSVYVVRAGDTLWEIAEARVGPEADPRVLVAEIAEANDLMGSRLVPGVELVIPAG